MKTEASSGLTGNLLRSGCGHAAHDDADFPEAHALLVELEGDALPDSAQLVVEPTFDLSRDLEPVDGVTDGVKCVDQCDDGRVQFCHALRVEALSEHFKHTLDSRCATGLASKVTRSAAGDSTLSPHPPTPPAVINEDGPRLADSTGCPGPNHQDL